jgi:predicted Zn-dependent peptidase
LSPKHNDRSRSPVTVDLSSLPNAGRVFGYDMIRPEMQRLSNGIPVYFVNAGKHDLVRVELIFKAGNYYQSKKLLAFFTNRMLREGTLKHTAKQLAEIIEFYGAFLSVTSDKDRASVSMLMLEKQLPHLLPLLGEIVREPAFNDPELEILKSRQQQEFRINMQKVSFLASRQFGAMVFGEKHPYGKTYNTQDFKKISREDLCTFYENHYTPSNCTILVTGKAVKGMYQKIDRIFGDNTWTGKFQPEKPIIPTTPSPERQVFIHKPDAVQASIRVGKATIDHRHPDFVGLKILNTLFGGYFGSRLMKNIREDKGYTYGISSFLLHLEKTGCWMVAADVNVMKSQETIDQVFYEMDKLMTKKPGNSELNLVKNYMLGSFIRSVDGPFDLAEKFKDMLLMGLADNYFTTYIDTIQKANPGMIHELARKYMEPGSFHTLIVGKKPESKS